jgi:hypothetical protein
MIRRPSKNRRVDFAPKGVRPNAASCSLRTISMNDLPSSAPAGRWRPSAYSLWIEEWRKVRGDTSNVRYAALVQLLNQPIVSNAVRLRERVPALSLVPDAARMSLEDALAAFEGVSRVRDSRVSRRLPARATRILWASVVLALVAAVAAIAMRRERTAQVSTAAAPLSGADSVRLAAALEAMARVEKLCSVREEAPHVVVECRSDIPLDQRLEFARVFANADAVISHGSRNIYFYLPSGEQFAQADPLNGIRLKE